MRYRPKHIVEYLFVRAVVSGVMALPYRCALALGWFLAWFSHCVVRFRVSRARARIREVFGESLSERDVRRIAWLSWRNFFFCVIDMIRMPLVTPDWIAAHGIGPWAEQVGVVQAHCATGKGAILAGPHMGAWELVGVTLQTSGVPIFFITGRQKNPLVDRYLNRLRTRTGIEAVQKGSAMVKGVIDRIRRGQVLAFLPDVRMPSHGIHVRFLGKEASVAGAMALFARQTGAPIFPGIALRVGWSRHTGTIGTPVIPDPAADKRADWQRMTQEVFSQFEKAVLSHPEQWFWFNKRWILDPVTDSPSPRGQEPDLEDAPAGSSATA